MMENLYDLSYQEISSYIKQIGEQAFRAEQIWQGLYQHAWADLNEFTMLPLSLREKIAERYHLRTLSLDEEQSSQDGTTRKCLYRLNDGLAIETVLMAYSDRQTVCISSQVGCAMGCTFCATGDMGLSRNLTQGEIIAQVLLSSTILREEGKSLTNVVLMGMGEPFHNYQAVMDAIGILNDPNGFNMGARRFTVSTVGLVPGIRKFTEENTQVNLALSLHAADDHLRSKIVPINTKYPLKEVLEACDEYLEKTNRRITIEWALIAGINDGPEQAEKLIQLLAGKLYHVNLIQLNPVGHFAGLPSKDENAAKFQDILRQGGLPCTIRLRRGIDIQAGCGQLASQSQA
jgi:23S rRNA (adenine2503-C2)-methyltransferase